MKHINEFYLLRRYFPRKLWDRLISPLGRTVLGPWQILIKSGWLRSVWRNRALDARGNPIPWLSGSCVAWLDAKINFYAPTIQLFGSDTVLEFGGGQSTKYFQRKDYIVDCIEPDAEWRKEIASHCKSNLYDSFDTFKLAFTQRTYTQVPYKIVLVDLNPREAYINFLLENTYLISHKTLIIIDNTDQNKFGDILNSRIKRLQEKCMLDVRVDFTGVAAGAIAPQTTTVIFCSQSSWNL